MKGNIRIVKGDSLLTATQKTEKETTEYKSQVKKCLTYTKPASKCKGNCK